MTIIRWVREHRWIAHGSVGAALAAVYMAGPGGGAWELVFASVGLWAALGVALAARGDAEASSGRVLIAAGLVCASLGDILLASYEWRGNEAPFPSVADAAYIGGYVLLSAGLVRLSLRRASGETLIDACIVAVGILGVVWLSVVQPIVEEGWRFASVVALSYPVGAVILLVASLHLWLGWGFPTTAMRLLGLGLLAWLVADAVYAHQALDGTYENGTILDAGWLLAYVLVGVGAMHPSLHQMGRHSGDGAALLHPNRFVLLAVAAAATPLATALFQLGPVGPLMALTVVGIALSAFRLVSPVRSLRHHAFRDALTGLPNRRMLTERLQDALDALRPDDAAAVGLLFCDLDHFKVINDSLGHPAGDELITVVGARLASTVRGAATVARLGGDEFVVLLPDVTEERTVTEAIVPRLLAEVSAPVALSSGHTVSPSMSVGIRLTRDPAAEASALLGDADAAMYVAKSNGRGRAVAFDASMREAALDRFVTHTELRRAIDENEIFCVYQPELDLHSGTLFGLECLVRWQHPERGVLEPGRFIPHAERSGLIDDLFRVVLHDALAAQASWTAAFGHRPPVAVNVSGAQRVDGTFVSAVLGALREHGAPPDSLWLEVTESALVDEQLSAALEDLRHAGVRVAVDDFGTGWSSLSRLAAAQWDALKIDRSFVEEIAAADEASQVSQVVRATVAMAHALGMLTVAEGVETDEERDRVRALGCDIVQGYLLARPVPADDVVATLRSLQLDGAPAPRSVTGAAAPLPPQP